MKRLIFPILGLLIFSYSVHSQEPIKPASPGFDVVHDSIAHGKIESFNSVKAGKKITTIKIK